MEQYDVIIVGSGVGALGAGLYLQSKKESLRILILEQHALPGGYISGFYRDGFYFDSGALGLTSFQDGGKIRKVLEELGFYHDYLPVDPIEQFHFKDKIVTMHADHQKFIQEIEKHYPGQGKPLKEFLMTCKTMKEEADKAGITGKLSLFQKIKVMLTCPVLMKYARVSYDEMLSEFITNDEVKEIFYIYGSWFGQTLRELGAPAGAVVTAITHFDGIYYPRGGMLQLAQGIAELFEDKGGEIRYKSKVEKILIEKKKAIGVQLSDGTKIQGKWIISNADIKRTVNDYVGAKHFPKKYVQYINDLTQSPSGVVLNLGVNMDLSDVSPHMTTGRDIEDIIIARENKDNYELNNIILRVMTQIDPSTKNGNGESVVLYYLAPYYWKNKWMLGENNKRTREYKQLKKEITKKMLKLADNLIPELSEHVVFKALATPHTFERYTLNTEGAWHGPSLINDPPEFTTPIKNLLLAGSNTIGSGAPRAFEAGFISAEYLFKKIL
jgi:prolycopene isomerase